MGELVGATAEAFIARHLGEAGRAWLATVPGTVAALAERWGLEIGEPLRGGVLSCVFAVSTAEGDPAVLKLAGPWDRPADEIACLERWQGVGAPLLLQADPDRGALLLERIEPGTSAVEAEPAAVASLVECLHLAPPPGMRELADVARGRVERALADGRASSYQADWAIARIDALGADAPAPVLLHGDFDERNILASASRGLVAIDPLPCVGDPAYDAGHWAQANGRPGRRARTAAIAEALGLPVERVRGWCAVAAIHG
jgi:streptomycin 6-kinase